MCEADDKQHGRGTEEWPDGGVAKGFEPESDDKMRVLCRLWVPTVTWDPLDAAGKSSGAGNQQSDVFCEVPSTRVSTRQD